ncbi:glutamate-5-semialdehyde dehydrogenase [Shewanella sp. 10N.286.52.C2]|uniref:glutamate-5-semialdehyde dehydrogenase n=1 Tax=unclassified Shewanella TaxID=196818 RepID=UPI000C8212F1|nr:MULTISPECIES: glutamate-5-semialdehyde dehydrogenase [unclassified Shewanella]MDO6640034.1 glutamate-5-semialdehyde dehydrogenase [Shewanella sp. 5_MG-2023]MDO6677779.1 glutamate-5-semialdehyde dehydrogenase [Shewanella sp. 4_MG-2023]PMG26930.1 glutamate-5-semialdehyde dehydrogenase [Shewanella sp. 10N.286.52.C2]
MSQQQYLTTLGKQAKAASFALANLSSQNKNALLRCISEQLTLNTEAILAANDQDVQAARANGLTDAMIDRLLLDSERLAGIIADIENVINLADPVGSESASQLLDNGLRLTQRKVPLGVVGVIYEARPNVTVDIAVLALKTGNAVILRGGKETLTSNKVLSEVIRTALTLQGLPEDAVQLINSTDRDLVTGLLRLDQYVDMIIPRGGQTLQRLCAEKATIPVILGGIGICHLYLDKSADLSRSAEVIINAKVQRPTVCNALDTLLVHEAVAAEFLADLFTQMSALGVSFYTCEKTQQLFAASQFDIHPATDETFSTEWLSLTLGVKIVTDIDQAITHIRQHSSGHSEAILSDDINATCHFMNQVDSAAVYVNASTRFTDGSQFGLGAEVAVSTQKLHARGPMALDALTTYKWLATGDYTSRS